MSSITKIFFSFFIFLTLCLVFIGVDLISQNTNKQQNIKEFATISKLPNSVLSVSHFESRFREYKDTRYNENKDINYMDFSRR